MYLELKTSTSSHWPKIFYYSFFLAFFYSRRIWHDFLHFFGTSCTTIYYKKKHTRSLWSLRIETHGCVCGFLFCDLVSNIRLLFRDIHSLSNWHFKKGNYRYIYPVCTLVCFDFRITDIIEIIFFCLIIKYKNVVCRLCTSFGMNSSMFGNFSVFVRCLTC